MSVTCLSYHHVTLRPRGVDDINLLFEWRNNLSELAKWSLRRYPVTREEFQAEFEDLERRTVQMRLMIDVKGNTIGTVTSYDYNLVHGWTYVSTYLSPNSRVRGVGAIVWGLFAPYLFDNFPFRKLYTEIYGFNRLSLKTAQSADLTLEAQIKDRYFWRGKYYDMYLFSLEREQIHKVTRFIP